MTTGNDDTQWSGHGDLVDLAAGAARSGRGDRPDADGDGPRGGGGDELRVWLHELSDVTDPIGVAQVERRGFRLVAGTTRPVPI